jgi:hypothetical protein
LKRLFYRNSLIINAFLCDAHVTLLNEDFQGTRFARQADVEKIKALLQKK